MKTYGGVDIQIHVFLISALVVREWSASHPRNFTPGKDPSAPTEQEIGWVPELVWTWKGEKFYP
jgi:hypothetical protein